MRLRTAMFFPLLVAAACSSNKQRAQPDSGGDPDAAPTAFEYRPQGCAYVVSPPETRGFADLSVDDNASVDPTGGAPIRVRLGLAGGTDSTSAGYSNPATSAAFTWETAASVRAAKVRLGKSATQIDQLKTGYSWTTPPPTVGLGTSEGATYMHEVHVCGLEPATTYYYQVGGGAPGSEVWSAVQSFTTIPTTGKIVVGVSGDARDSAMTYEALQKRFRDLAVAMQVFSGDLVLSGTVASLYKNWLDPVWKDGSQPGKFVTLGQQLMVMVGGNHESAASQFYGNFAIPGDGPFAETFGSFNVGGVHFAFFDDQRVADSPTGDQALAQIAWLKGDLDRANKSRDKQPFIVFVNHRPQFSTSHHKGEGDVVNVANATVPIFDQYGVDLVIGGHDHDFERSKPLRGGTVANPTVVAAGQGTIYLVSAGAGADAYGPGTGAEPYSEKRATFQGNTGWIGLYTLLTIDGTTLKVSSYGLKPSGQDDMVDEFTLSH